MNGYTVYRLPPYTETGEGARLFYLKYTPATYWNTGAVYTSATLEIASRGPEGSGALVLPDGGTDGAFYFQLGRVLWNNGSPRAIQDHTAGVAEVRWYAKC